jgi:hypothetical protein
VVEIFQTPVPGDSHLVVEIFQTLVQLVTTLLTLIAEVGALTLRHALLITWVAWWLWGVNWTKAWKVLANGGWAVVVLLSLISALAWAGLAPSTFDCLGFFSISNFWWQLGAVTLLVLLTFLCGWVQGAFGWTPTEIDLEPPAHAELHGHGHH